MKQRLALVLLLSLGGCRSTLYDSSGRPDLRTVGSAGGVVHSRDGRLTLSIPPGAVADPTVIEVLQEEAPADALAAAYRITPEQLGFALPATLTLTQQPSAGYQEMPVLGRVVQGGPEWLANSRAIDGAILAEATQLGVFSAWQRPCTTNAACTPGNRCVAGACGPCAARETCGDGVDDDCNGVTDDGCCADDAHDGLETDLDCGGGCPACADGRGCREGRDCASGSCTESQCAPSCSAANGGCSPDARCSNTPSARVCTCLPGFTGSGTSCDDVDECKVANGGCDPNATCRNLRGSRACICEVGFAGDGLACARTGLHPRAPWPMTGGNPQHTGQSSFRGPQTNRVHWTYVKSLLVGGLSVSATGDLYAGGDTLEVIDSTGALRWSLDTHGTLNGTPAIAEDGTFYVGAENGRLYAVRPGGGIAWSFPTGNPVRFGAAIGVDGTVYAGSFDGNLYALSPAGDLKWSLHTPAGLGGPAVALDGTIYVTNRDGPSRALWAVRSDGTFRWSSVLGSRTTSNPAIGGDGTVYVAGDASLFAFAADGAVKWSFPTGDNIVASPAIDASGTILIGSNDGNLYAINPDGTRKWVFKTGKMIQTSAIIDVDGAVYFGSADTRVYALGPDGTQRWAFPTGNAVSPSLALGSDGLLYVGTLTGDVLYAIGP